MLFKCIFVNKGAIDRSNVGKGFMKFEQFFPSAVSNSLSTNL